MFKQTCPVPRVERIALFLNLLVRIQNSCIKILYHGNAYSYLSCYVNLNIVNKGNLLSSVTKALSSFFFPTASVKNIYGGEVSLVKLAYPNDHIISEEDKIWQRQQYS